MTDTKTSKPSSLKIDIPQPELLKPKITIFGVGGAGGNAINNMIRSNLEGVEFVAANTDAQALQSSLAESCIQLGAKTTKGLGAGSFPDRGRVAAEENLEEIEGYLEGNNMVFIAAGMGGGTGTGAAPVIAQLARERDILTVGVITKPFHFEGKYRMETAEQGIEELKKYVDTLIIIPNQNLFRIANEQTTFESAFKMADDVLHAGVRGVTDLITMPGLVNLDFADIRTIMTKMGKAMMGTGEADGENRAVAACEAAISNPLLDDISIKGAKGVLVNMTGGMDMTLFEADMAVNAIKKEVDPNANIIFGSAFNENMNGKIRISVVATGIDVEEFRRDTLRGSESNEPTRFQVDMDESSDLDIHSSSESFFDPGISAKTKEDIPEEIVDNNFSTNKSYLKEPNQNYDNQEAVATVENEIPSAKASVIESDFTQDSFFADDLDTDLETNLPESNALKEPDIKEAPEKSKEKPVKKEGGFSLFSFMNSSKVKPSENEDSSQTLEEKLEVATKEDENIASKNKVKDAREVEKKRQKFFSSTIFDEEDDDNSSSNRDDEEDILNVPAFFRRKKK